MTTAKHQTWSQRGRMRWRSATRRARTLPDFLILGGQRCGSTTLYSMMAGHPQVMEASHKEPHFFDNNHHRGEDFYRRLFPLELHRRAREWRLGTGVVTGEATTYYLPHPAVPERVAAALPDVRLIAILRDPVDRAHSHFQLSVREGREPLSFERALESERERIAGEEQRLLSDPAYRGVAHRFHSYQTRGLYLEQLERWWNLFPEHRLLVLRSEDMFADPRAVYDRVAGFLGLEPDPARDDFETRNRVGYEDMDPDTRAQLSRFYAEPNRLLEQRLGRALHWQTAE
ncbi:MAG: sulfotransferase domain-containing protein [Chloroflexota bacterium]|nr:sulfotransferase domain-containing protein [Chloroflexota bacterium]